MKLSCFQTRDFGIVSFPDQILCELLKLEIVLLPAVVVPLVAD